MSVLARFMESAKQRSLTVVLPEGQDDRIMAAARRMKDEGIAGAVLLGDREKIEAQASALKIGLDGIDVIAPADSDKLEQYTEAYVKGRDLNPNRGAANGQATPVLRGNDGGPGRCRHDGRGGRHADGVRHPGRRVDPSAWRKGSALRRASSS